MEVQSNENCEKNRSGGDDFGGPGGADHRRDFKAGEERRRDMVTLGFAGIAAIAGLIFAAVVLVTIALQP